MPPPRASIQYPAWGSRIAVWSLVLYAHIWAPSPNTSIVWPSLGGSVMCRRSST